VQPLKLSYQLMRCLLPQVYNAGLVIQYLTHLGLTQRHIAASIVPRCVLFRVKGLASTEP
jgi:hypothetical protein